MIAAIADTHTAIWYLYSDPRLGRAASAFIDTTIINGDHIGLSAISLAEMVYLIEKGRIPANTLDDVLAAIADPKAVLQQVPLDDGIVIQMRTVSRQDIPDLPDPHHCCQRPILRCATVEPRCSYTVFDHSHDLVTLRRASR